MDPELSIAVLDGLIKFVQTLLLLSTWSHFARTICLHTLAVLRLARYKLSRQTEDLNKSIVHYTEAHFLPPVSWAGPLLGVVRLLFRLAFALLCRSVKLGQREVVKYRTEYLRYVRRLPLESFDVRRIIATTLLIRALATQAELEAGDGTRNIEEMVVLCRELLTSNISADFLVGAFKPLHDAVNAEFIRGRSIQSLDEVIECQREVVRMCSQGSHPGSIALASSLLIRFVETHSNDDYEDAIALLETILDPSQPGECPDSIRGLASLLATMLAFARSAIFQNPEYSEMAISRLRAELSSSFIDEGLYFRLAESLEEANSYILQAVDLSSSQSLAKSGGMLTELDAVRETYSTTAIQQNIQQLEILLSNNPRRTEHHERLLRGLADWYRTKFFRTNDISDIEESIKYSRLLLDATHPNGLMRVNSLCSLRNVLLVAFERTNRTNYLDESIILGYETLKAKRAQFVHFQVIQQLVSSLLTRSRLLGGTEDPHEAIRLMSLAIDDQYAREPDRFRLSCAWAFLARHISHPSALIAYKSAMSSMQRSLSFAPTISIQHTRLVAVGEHCQSMPLDYASYQIDLGRFEEAVETLEQGRALLWSEMRGLRTPITQLAEEDSPLAKRFAEVNQELEALTTSVTPSGRLKMEDGVAEGGDGTDPFDPRPTRLGRLLRAPSFSTLRSAALRGPVILINHCRWRSDILILFPDSPLSFIPTTNDFFDRANKLRDELVEAREHGLDSGKYQDALCSVLKGLYELVGEPVIERLRVLGVPEQSRIWWCPTSVFCSLPLHAMGPIPSSDTPEQYFSDLYIPSYTPSLSALIESHKPIPRVLDKPSILLVAQPDDSLPGVWGEMEVVQALNAQVTNLVLNAATPTSVVEGLRGSRFAHFACHGELETGKPFEASFKLHGGSRLTLLDIVQSHLPDAEFAFLSCCHAAELTKNSIADEALHLTSAMQYCGFRSVVGTMWEMVDTDGRDLAASFYKSLFSRERAGVPYYERSAEALRDATQKLRKKRGITLERWANFVHYGA
ncbi:CHAT domain-containing protein [Lactarius psammicola]|nr:CHAT domain-containing protein [Lactarius psammicola]